VSILELSRLEVEEREDLLKLLIPDKIFERYNISKKHYSTSMERGLSISTTPNLITGFQSG